MAIKEILTIFGVIAGFLAWLLGPLSLAFIAVFTYTGSGVAAAIMAVVVELVAVFIGLVIMDVL
jgi:hypothetical protein